MAADEADPHALLEVSPAEALMYEADGSGCAAVHCFAQKPASLKGLALVPEKAMCPDLVCHYESKTGAHYAAAAGNVLCTASLGWCWGRTRYQRLQAQDGIAVRARGCRGFLAPGGPRKAFLRLKPLPPSISRISRSCTLHPACELGPWLWR